MSNPIQRLQTGSDTRSVLIIDDDPELAESLSRILKMFFKKCVVATNGEEGLETFFKKANSSEPFTVVITDLELPKKGGLGVIKDIRAFSKSQPILILSAHDEAEFMSEAISLEVQGYLLKPLSMPKLFQHLEKILIDTTSEVNKTTRIDPVTEWKELSELEDFLQKNSSEPIALLHIRVNHLSNIYNLVGEEYANEYTKELAALLESLQINANGVFYRCAIDEFCLILNHDIVYAKNLAQEMVSITRYFHTSEQGIILNSTLSIGIAYGTKNILEYSRLALEKLLHSDSEGVSVYTEQDKDQHLTIVQGQEVLKMIFNALEDETIVPYVQPIISTSTKEIELFNSFIRIRQEEKIYGPDTFLNVAINTHQMTLITRSMIRNTLSLSASINPKNAILTILLTEEDINDEALLSYILFWTDRYHLNPSRIAFEIVSGTYISALKSPNNLINEIKLHGYKIILNQFGSGKCDLSALLKLNPDYIKIHPDITERIHTEPRTVEIIEKLVDMIHLIGAKAIVTHLSSEEDIRILSSIPIDYLQGYAVMAPYEVHVV